MVKLFILIFQKMGVVQNKLCVIEAILRNTTILLNGKHVLECVTSTALAYTGPGVRTGIAIIIKSPM